MGKLGITNGFCHQVWRRLKPLEELDKTKFFKDCCNNSEPTVVKYHGYLHSINGHLNGTSSGMMPREPMGFGLDISYGTFIRRSDVAFKRLAPLKENITVYRGIPKVPVFKKDKQLFERAINVKPGDTIAMREYAYCTPEKRYAESYSRNSNCDERIMYEIFIPKGARVSRANTNGYGDYTLPRYSRYKCISNETSENGLLHNIKLEYILPAEI